MRQLSSFMRGDAATPRSSWGERVYVSLCLSLLVHALLIAALPGWWPAQERAPSFLRVSLIASGGTGRAVGGGDAGRGALDSEGSRKISRQPKLQPVREAAPQVASVRPPPPPAGVAARPSLPSKPAVRHAQALAKQARKTSVETHQPPRGNAHVDAGSDGGESARAAGQGLGGGAGDGIGPGTGLGTGRGVGSGPGDGVDLRLACLRCPAPRYPRRAAARGAEGTVDVWFSLAEDGSVREVGLRSSSGNSDLDRAAIQVAQKSRFKLAAAGGPEAARGYIAYQFQLSR